MPNNTEEARQATFGLTRKDNSL